MVQFVRPTADLLTHAEWTTLPYWSQLDEGAPGGGDRVDNASPVPTDIIVLDGSTVTDPAVSTGHVIRVLWGKNSSQTGTSRITVQLRQGYVSEVSQGTLIATLIDDIAAQVDETATYTLTTTEADAITDYAGLSFRVHVGRDSGDLAARASRIDYVELEVPDASGGTVDLTHLDASATFWAPTVAATSVDLDVLDAAPTFHTPTVESGTAAALLVVGDKTALTAADLIMVDLLEEDGVTTVTVDSDSDAARPSGFDLVVIAESVTAADVGTKYDTSTMPALIFEQALSDEMRLSSNIQTAISTTSFVIDDPAHELAAGLSGTVTVLTAATGLHYRDTIGAGVGNVGHPSGGTTANHGYLHAETGATLMSGTAPARRVWWGIGEGPAVTNATADGLRLFRQMIWWASSGEIGSDQAGATVDLAHLASSAMFGLLTVGALSVELTHLDASAVFWVPVVEEAGGLAYVDLTHLDAGATFWALAVVGASTADLDHLDAASAFHTLEVRTAVPFEGVWGVLIDGVQVVVGRDTLDLNHRVQRRSTLRFAVQDLGGALAIAKHQPVDLWVVDERIFSGFVEVPASQRVTPGGMVVWQVTCVDNHVLADKRIIVDAFRGLAAGAVVRAIADELATEGVTYTGVSVQDGPTVEAAIFAYVPASKAFDVLGERAGFTWFIDADRVLWFVDRTTVEAPWVATGADMLRLPVVEAANPEYRNRQIVKGGKALTETQVESFLGDTVTQTFVLGYAVAEVPAVTVGGVAQTVGIRGLDTSADFYWSKGEKEITQDPDATPPSTSDMVEVAYRGTFPLVTISYDQTEIDRVASVDGSSGVVEAVMDAPEVLGRDESFERAATRLERYSRDAVAVRFVTRRQGLMPGQWLTVDLPDQDLNQRPMLVEQVGVREDGSTDLVYQVDAVDGPISESWFDFVEAVANRADVFVIRENISENEILTLLEQFSEGWSWADSVTQDVYACPIPSTGLFPAETLLPC